MFIGATEADSFMIWFLCKQLSQWQTVRSVVRDREFADRVRLGKTEDYLTMVPHISLGIIKYSKNITINA